MNFKAIVPTLLAICYFCFSSIAQYDPASLSPAISQCNENIVFLKVETMPELLGGSDKLVKNINSKVRIEKDKKKKYLSCKIAINCEGKVYDSSITMNSLDEETAQHILSIVEESTEFSAAKHKNETVDCYYYFHFFITQGKLKIYES